MFRASYTSGAQVAASTAQLREGNGWHMLSLDGALNILDRMVELPSVENFIWILQKCRKKKDLAYAKRVHAHICNHGLDVHRAVGNHIVPMFVECGSVSDAQQVFSRLAHRNEHSWTSLILGYIQRSQLQHALNLYKRMQVDNIPPSSFTLVSLLKVCAKLNDVKRGREIHVEIAQKGFESDLFVGNSLVSMYAKCGSLPEAQEVFEKLPVRDVVSWNAIIAGYAEHGPGQEALKCLQRMQLEGISLDDVTYISALKVCGTLGDIDKGRQIHREITQKGLATYPFVGNSLVDMYGKCGSLSEAREAFDKLPLRDVVSWNALIAGYVEHGTAQEVLECFEWMQLEGVSPDSVTSVCLLKVCGSLGALEKVREIHTLVTLNGLERDLIVGSTLVNMYAKCGSLSEGQEVFDNLSHREVVSWTTLIGGYAEHGPGQEALKCFEQMRLEGIYPDAVTFVCALKACGSIGAIDMGREFHAEITQQGLGSDLIVGSSLVDMYTKCGSFLEAREVFDKLPVREVVSWNALIAGYAEHGPGEQAFKCFEEMQEVGISPNAVTFVCVLKACGSIVAIEKGRDIHEQIAHMGFERDLSVCNTLVDMYAKCGSFAEAWEVMDNLPVRNVVSWNALIGGYAEHGSGEEALKCFQQMQVDTVCPDSVTYGHLMKVCGSTGAIDTGREIHLEIRQKGFESDLSVGNSLIGMYAKCGSLSEAQEVFDRLSDRNVVSWTAIIAGYAEHGYGQEALKCFEQMELDGIVPDAVAFLCALKACGSMGAIEKGREIHSELTHKGFARNLSVGNTLIGMYAKCGSLSEAQEVFDKLPVRDVVSWTTLIAGYAINHEGNMAVQCFKTMQDQGVKPSAITFTCLLSACSHANLVLKGQEYFKLMREEYGIALTVDHYTCMVDLLARSGHLYEAAYFLESMPCPLSEETWRALLTACKTYGEADLGLRCFKQLVEMNPEYSASYVLMADIYASSGRWDDVYRLEELRKHAGAKKKPGTALIEVDKKVHEFVVGDNQSKEISAMLEVLNLRMEEEGYVPNLDLVLRPMSDKEKGASLCEHAEKLAIAFGLLNTPQGQTLRVTKNLRMCNDCHSASKVISRVERREIIVRDIYCIHHFKDGLCSCEGVI